MREAHRRVGVERMQYRATRKAQFTVAAIDRLTTAASTSRRTGHHFDEVVIHRARIERRDKLVSVRQPMHDRTADRRPCQVEHRFLPGAFGGRSELEAGGFRIRAGHDRGRGTERCRHHAAGRAEDHACTRALIERIIERHVFERFNVDLALGDHACEFAGSERCIHIRHARVRGHARQCDLDLLRGARHERDREDLLWRKAVLLREPGLYHGAEHLHRALRR